MKNIHPLKKARIHAGLSIQDVSVFLSIHRTTLQRYEKGELFLPKALLLKLSQLYKLSPSALLAISETGYLFKKDFYHFYWQPSRASPHPELLSYMEALFPAQDAVLLFYFHHLTPRARHQLLGLAASLFRKPSGQDA